MADQKISALTAATALNDADLIPIVQGGANKSAAASVVKSYIQLVTRPKLTGNLTYYVRTDGNDANSGLVNNAGGAFLTIQHAIDVAIGYDVGQYTITIQVADGTYTAPITLKPYVASGGGSIALQGNLTTPANCIISVSGNHGIQATSIFCTYTISGFKIQTATSGHGIHIDGPANIYLGALNFGACAWSHVAAFAQATIRMINAYTISGSTGQHLYTESNGVIVCAGLAVTLSGTPNFSSAFAYATAGGTLMAHANTYSGAATGARYFANLNGVVFVAGAASAYLPGNAAGSTATGGQYG